MEREGRRCAFREGTKERSAIARERERIAHITEQGRGPKSRDGRRGLQARSTARTAGQRSIQRGIPRTRLARLITKPTARTHCERNEGKKASGLHRAKLTEAMSAPVNRACGAALRPQPMSKWPGSLTPIVLASVLQARAKSSIHGLLALGCGLMACCTMLAIMFTVPACTSAPSPYG